MKELYILKSLLKKENLEKYRDTLDNLFLSRDSPYQRIYRVLQLPAKTENGSYSTTQQVEIAFYAAFPGLRDSDREEATAIFTRLNRLEDGNEADLSALLESLVKEKAKKALALELLSPEENTTRLQELYQAVQLTVVPDTKEENFVSLSLKELYNEIYQKRGIRWGLECLNRSLGSLRKGNFGFINARPETGKTTFLNSQFAAWIPQVVQPILWFHNEETGGQVMLRNYCSVLNRPINEVVADIERSEANFTRIVGDRLKFKDDSNIHRREVEKITERVQPSLILFDQLDKIKGFQDDRNDLELGSIYQWARELAKAYAPVIGVSQAGASAENKRWLQMDDIANAKTSKQAEADWILGIGKIFDSGFENIRFLSICKNKLLGDDDSLPELRHGKFEVFINQQCARYEDIVTWP